jgi:hypothetical protein
MMALTTSQISMLPELIPSICGLQMAIELRAVEYGRAAEIEREADQEFNEAIDTEKPNYVRMDLAAHANLATQLRQEAQRELDEAKHNLLVMWS